MIIRKLSLDQFKHYIAQESGVNPDASEVKAFLQLPSNFRYGITYGLFDDTGAIVGYGYVPNADAAALDRVYITPNKRLQGLGTRFVDSLGTLTVYVPRNDAATETFFALMGFSADHSQMLWKDQRMFRMERIHVGHGDRFSVESSKPGTPYYFGSERTSAVGAGLYV